MSLPRTALLALLPFLPWVTPLSGSGTTTRYWDCCKASCSWPGKATLLSGSNPVTSCDISNNPLTDYNAVSGCDGGTAYQCSNESPWAVTDDLAYGYAAVNIAGGSEATWCCACYELTFTSGAVAGKKMVVQATNTGGDLGSNQFDISIPGGGVGIFNGCTTQYDAPSSGWGAQYGGVSDEAACSALPAALQPGCDWRFDWFLGADNPTVDFVQVACPAALTANSGCVRADDASEPAADGASASAVVSSSTAVSSSAVAAGATSSTFLISSSSLAEDTTIVSSSVAVATPVSHTANPSSSSKPIRMTTVTVPPTSSSAAELTDTTTAPEDSGNACEL